MSEFILSLRSFFNLVKVFIMFPLSVLFLFCMFFSVSFCLFYTSSHAVQMMDVRFFFFFFNHWDIHLCNKIKTWISLIFFSFLLLSLSLSPQTSRVPVGAAVAHHNLNDLIMIHGIPLQQRNLGTLDRITQYEHHRGNKHNLIQPLLCIFSAVV